ncbi:hypothetical protein V5O48_011642 [Marasmius crinis-equi]|uniref:Uncharacterized protein n=1 Tax=Marasmius crinis-equi TaxID=585013 RepID=A0ABR3F522_9AGAR
MKLSDKCYNTNKETYPHGHFVPHSSLPQYTKNSVFCFHYPILMLLTSATSVAFYDVPTRELLSTVSLSSNKELSDTDEPLSLPDFGRVWSADFSPTHIFLCALKKGSRIFDRETGKCVLDIPADRWFYASKVIRMADQAGQASNTEEEDLSKFDFDPVNATPPPPCPYHMDSDNDEEGQSEGSDDADDDQETSMEDDDGDTDWEDDDDNTDGEDEEEEFDPHLQMLLTSIPFGSGDVEDPSKENTDTQSGTLPKSYRNPKIESILAAATFADSIFPQKSRRGAQAAFIVDLGDFRSSSGDVKIKRAVSFDSDDPYEVEITDYGVYLGWDRMFINGWKKWRSPEQNPT